MFAEGPTRVRGVAHNRHKETDRIADLARELRKFGGRVEEHADGLTICPATFASRRDDNRDLQRSSHGHEPGLDRVEDARRDHTQSGLHAKTYPNYWQDLEQLSGKLCRVHRLWTAAIC